MPALFFDTSAMLKRWFRERGTARVLTLLEESRQEPVYVSSLLGVECIAALARRHGAREIGEDLFRRALDQIRSDLESLLDVIETDSTVIARAMMLAERHRIRGADSVHLAAACEVADASRALGVPAPIFIASDADLIRAATAEGLTTENPEASDPPAPEPPSPAVAVPAPRKPARNPRRQKR